MRLPFLGGRGSDVPAAPSGDAWSTMIVPAGTEMRAGAEGRLSIRTPGNLVLQSSGRYHTLESTAGSIRIEPRAEIEAVEVICRDVLYVQGSLVAWRVAARALQLEHGARAHVVLQEAEQLEIGRSARLVGNFGSDREMLGLFSRFARELRSMPVPLVPREEPFADGPTAAGGSVLPADVVDEAVPGSAARLPDPLFFALLLLERAHGGVEGREQRVIGGVVRLLREGDLEALRQTHRTLFSRAGRGDDVGRAAELVAGYFRDTV